MKRNFKADNKKISQGSRRAAPFFLRRFCFFFGGVKGSYDSHCPRLVKLDVFFDYNKKNTGKVQYVWILVWKRKLFFMNGYGTGTSSFSQMSTGKGTGTGNIQSKSTVTDTG